MKHLKEKLLVAGGSGTTVGAWVCVAAIPGGKLALALAAATVAPFAAPIVLPVAGGAAVVLAGYEVNKRVVQPRRKTSRQKKAANAAAKLGQ